MPFSLDGKTAVVTGAASGIGMAVATVLSRAGARVHVLDLTSEAAKQAASKINGEQPKQRSIGHGCDVSDEASVQTTFDAICAAGERIDILVCNAGISAVGTVTCATTEEMDSIAAHIELSHALAPYYAFTVVPGPHRSLQGERARRFLLSEVWCEQDGCRRQRRPYCEPGIDCISHWPCRSVCLLDDEGCCAEYDSVRSD